MGKDQLPDELRGHDIPQWANWLAQDEDGTWWAYEAEPNQQHNGWYENEVGRIQRLTCASPPIAWQEALIRLTASVQK